MRERPQDTGIAVGLALGVHLLVFLLLYLGWRLSPAPAALSVAGPPIEVEFVPASAVRDRPRSAAEPPPRPQAPRPVEQEAAPPPQPRPEPAPQTAQVEPQPAPQAPQVVPDTRQQERASRDAVSPKPPAPREQEERRRQQQVDLTERERQDSPESRQRLTQQQLERLRQLAQLQQRRAELSQQSRMEQQRLEQQRDLAQRQPTPPAPARAAAPHETTPPPMAGNDGTDDSLQAAYVLAIQNAVERHWIRPDTIPPGTQCTVRAIQIPGGEVIRAEVQQPCRFDPIGQRSLEAAVLRAQPLPYAGFETVFSRVLVFTFTAPQD
ncbi:MAG: hypothetical protein KatS3mg128_0750 [Silanimonas sp.]|nr:MAG: hypothetical protein KatS3mg128_0750 [Silanimonas sp.]